MRTVYALLVGIDDYPRGALRGCVNDIRAVRRWLRSRSVPPVDVRTLYDGQATREAVLEGLRGHLGRAGAGDTALFWFCGHGTRRPDGDPRSASGWSEALVCHDSPLPGGQPLLRDGELGALLDGIAARGTHVVAVLDCCHAGGATREGVRGTEWRPWWCPEAGTRAVRPGPRRHTLLAACRPDERAHESDVEGLVRGDFSHALLNALDRLGPTTTCGKLHASAHGALAPRQRPELHGTGSARFLGGDDRTDSAFLLRHTRAGWEVDCGKAHGLRAPGAEFTVLGEGAPRTVAVRRLRAESALVEPVDWQPTPVERESVFEVTPSALAFAPTAVAVTGEPGAVQALREAVAGVAGLAPADGDGDGPLLRVDVGADRARVSGGAGHPVPELPLRSAADAARVVDCLVHLARWHRLLQLSNPDPWLSSRVRVSVEPTGVGALRRTPDGEVVCGYTRDGREPQVTVRLHNDSGRRLWCVLLDLTDGYACSPELCEGEFVGPGRSGTARGGAPVWLRLPPGRALVRGASARDWLKLIVTEHELNPAPFGLPAWPTGPGTTRDRVSALAPLRLTAPATARDIGRTGPSVGRWGTVQVAVRTEVT
ncbi:caspase domain-containing protein [Streptomyces sp. NPDC090106]|uniref:caspase family protein n=1 Tax=Streptomyces sp. NPDC090106 TaxID=3365946 RepID=UPI003822F1C4